MTHERQDEFEDALVTLLESGVGYFVSLFDMLDIRALECEKTFAVSRHKCGDGSSTEFVYEEIFADAREAVKFFEQERRLHEIGCDIEGILNSDNA